MNVDAILRHIETMWGEMCEDVYLSGFSELPEKLTLDHIIRSHSWNTGGYSGGNCWGDEAEYYQSDEDPPEFTFLEDIVMSLTQDITYKEFKKIKSHVKIHSYGDVGYYGNVDYYNYYYIETEKLAEILNEIFK